MPHAVPHSTTVVEPQSPITSILIKRLVNASLRRPDSLRFQLAVMIEIATIFMQKTSAVRLISVADRNEVEDAFAVGSFFVEIENEFDRYNISEKERAAALVDLWQNILEHVSPKLLI